MRVTATITITTTLLLLLLVASGASPQSSGMVLRIRLEDGSIEKHLIPKGAEQTMTLHQLLGGYAKSEEATIKVGPSTVEDDSKSLEELNLKHGSMIAIVGKATPTKKPASFAPPSDDKDTFHPFPDLAKDYKSALRQKARRRGTKGGMSYADMANLQSALHVIEPQAEGSLKRIYMCHVSAERFQSNCIVQRKGSKPFIQNRVALLLGTLHRERVDVRPKKVRTSLSSNPSANDFCQVAKVHALWEPSQQGTEKSYGSTNLVDGSNAAFVRMLKLAKVLDLQPVGWIFSYNDNRLEGDDSLPVWGSDIVCGATLQIEEMKGRGRADGSKFVTLAMDANGGATEAFQLSDVSVQMVSEGILGEELARFVSTTQPVLVDSKEIQQLDSVLCLVNIAMLSHKGIYSGRTTNVVKKSGSLTTKTKKAVLAALETDNISLLNALSDFNILLALDVQLKPEDTEGLCHVVQKWARGQKRGTEVPLHLKKALLAVLRQ